MIEQFESGGEVLATVIRAEAAPDATQFVTPDEMTLQVGFVVYPAGGEVAPHRHRPIERRIVGTQEVLLVRDGRCKLDLFDDAGSHVSAVELGPGDVVVLLAGGHGVRMLEDTVLLEVKQGPYLGLDEKERLP